MIRQRWLVGTTLLAFLLNTADLCRADEATSVKVLEEAKATIIRADGKSEKHVVGVIMWGPGYNGGLLKELKQLKSLQKLRIGGPWVTDDGVKELRKIKTLQMLEIRSPKVSDAALKDLQEALPKLKVRRALPDETPFAAFADEATSVKVLEQAKAIIIRAEGKSEKPVMGVIMWGAGYNGDLLKELKQLKSLQKLRIGGPWITDDGVKELREIKTLQMLEIRSPKVSDAALKDLQKALPKLKLRRALPDETPFAAFEEKK